MKKFYAALFLVFISIANSRGDNGSAKRSMYFESDDAYIYFSLISKDNVRNELKLNNEQFENIIKIYKTNTPEPSEVTSILDNLRKSNLRKDNPKKYSEELDKALKITADYKKNEVLKVLNKNQMDRLKEIYAQYIGPSIITIDKETERRFNLEKKQLEKIDKNISHYNSAIDLLIKTHGKMQFSKSTPNETNEQKQNALNNIYETILVLQKDKDENTLSLLSEEQIKIYKNITGKPLPIDWGPCYLADMEPFK